MFAVIQKHGEYCGSGAWAEYAPSDAINCIPLRDDITDEDGAAQIVNPLTALGAATVLDVTAPDFTDQFTETSRQFKPRVFLDAVSDQISEAVFIRMPNGARWISYGKLGTDTPRLTEMGQLIFMGNRIEGFWLTQRLRSTPHADQMCIVGEVQARFADRRWKTDISARLRLRDVVSGLAAATKIPGGKILITP